MYREPAEPSPSEAAPSELVVETSDARRSTTYALWLQLFALPPVVAVVLSAAVSPEVGLAGLVASAAGALAWWRRPRRAGLLLRVASGDLTVSTLADGKVAVSIPLRELLDVRLDTKTIQPLQESGSAVPALRLLEARPGPELDVARVVLVGRSDPFVPLGETYVAHLHATEALGRLRVFLRKNGWVPDDEREPPPPPTRARAPGRNFA